MDARKKRFFRFNLSFHAPHALALPFNLCYNQRRVLWSAKFCVPAFDALNRTS